ncbi:MAG: hypothetical protein M5U26_01765 [Planctomycetota bacterium]|nr:hypothetical protein [Planctomycetota bacterium]
MTPPPIETVSVEQKDGRFVVVVRRGGIEATGADQDEQTALFAARIALAGAELKAGIRHVRPRPPGMVVYPRVPYGYAGGDGMEAETGQGRGRTP